MSEHEYRYLFAGFEQCVICGQLRICNNDCLRPDYEYSLSYIIDDDELHGNRDIHYRYYAVELSCDEVIIKGIIE